MWKHRVGELLRSLLECPEDIRELHSLDAADHAATAPGPDATDDCHTPDDQQYSTRKHHGTVH